MKKLLFLTILLVSTHIWGATNDSLKIVTLQREVDNLKSIVSRFQQEDGRLRSLYQQ